jgi:hypothetical protein
VATKKEQIDVETARELLAGNRRPDNLKSDDGELPDKRTREERIEYVGWLSGMGLIIGDDSGTDWHTHEDAVIWTRVVRGRVSGQPDEEAERLHAEHRQEIREACERIVDRQIREGKPS